MKTTGMAAILAMTTALGGAAWGQTITTLADENNTIRPWGSANTHAYGQVITLNAATRLDSATFRIRDAGTAISYELHVIGWDSRTRQGVGASLGSATGATSGSGTMENVVTQTGGIDLAPGEYIVFLQAVGGGTGAQWGTAPDSAYAGGQFVFQNNGGDTTQWTGSWSTSFPRDLAFELLFNLGPTRDAELAAALGAAAGTGRLLIVGADGVVRDAGAVSLATRDARMVLTRVAEGPDAGQVTASAQDAPGMMGNVFTWAEVTGFRSDDYGSGNGVLGGSGLQIGADIEVGAGMVAGVSLGYSDVTAESGGFRTEGTYTYLQPYFSYRAGDWSGTASLVHGRGSFDQTSLGGAGEADVTLTAFTFEGGYDYALAPGTTLTPTIGLIHGRESVDGTAGTLAGTSADVTFSQGSLGARLAYETEEGALFAGLHADYLTQDPGSVLTQDLLAEDGWSGRFELGGETELDNGLGLSASVEVGGLGSGLQTLSGGLRIGFTF